MNIISRNRCMFCSDDSKIDKGGHVFCPNGHYILTPDREEPFVQKDNILYPSKHIVECLQPRSNGSGVEGKNIFRLYTITGKFCTKEGIKIE